MEINEISYSNIPFIFHLRDWIAIYWCTFTIEKITRLLFGIHSRFNLLKWKIWFFFGSSDIFNFFFLYVTNPRRNCSIGKYRIDAIKLSQAPIIKYYLQKNLRNRSAESFVFNLFALKTENPNHAEKYTITHVWLTKDAKLIDLRIC